MKRIIHLVVISMVAAVILISTAYANPAHDQISKFSETERRKVFTGYMEKSGENCNVTRTFFQGQSGGGDAFWNVRCSNGKSWVIQINNDSKGSTRILECSVLEAMNAGKCFKKFKNQ